MVCVCVCVRGDGGGTDILMTSGVWKAWLMAPAEFGESENERDSKAWLAVLWLPPAAGYWLMVITISRNIYIYIEREREREGARERQRDIQT